MTDAPPFEVVDVHHHLGAKPTVNAAGYYGAEDMIRDMDANSVAQSVVMHFVSTLKSPEAFARANTEVAKIVASQPGRLFGTVVVSPLFAVDALREVRTYHAAGFRMVKLHPVHHGNYSVNSGIADPVIELAGELSMPVLIHSDFSSPVCSPYEIAALARRFPRTTIVLAHLGLHPDHCRRVPEIVADVPNIVLDTSQTPDFPFDVYVHPCKVIGSDRVMFGSDGPECSVALNIRKVEMAMDHGLAEHDARNLLGLTARRLLRLEP